MLNNINRIAKKCLQECEFPFGDKKYNNKQIFKDDKEYQKSFKEIKVFSDKFKLSQKKNINCIIFNENNADGKTAAAIILRFLAKKLNKELTENDVTLINVGPHSGEGIDYKLKKLENDIKDKNIIIVDLAYNIECLNYFKKIGKSVILIDDHPITNNIIKKTKLKKTEYYIGDDKHGACAYTWKFLYPKKKVPYSIQMIETSDRKQFLNFLGNTRPYMSFLNYRILFNKRLKWNNLQSFAKLLEYLFNTNTNFSKFVGHYYDQVVNNIKEQIAINAQLRYFEGHPVYVLNYKDPALYKMVQRQMLTNAEKKGDKIHFAVLWTYEYTINAYNVSLSEIQHTSPKYNLPGIAYKLGKIGKIPRGGGGSKNAGNFYWPRGNGKDIWDLFNKTPKYL